MKKKKPEKNPVYSGIIMKTVDCRACGQRFMVQNSLWDSVIEGSGDDFWCPRGHVLYHVDARKKRDEERRLAREKAEAEKKALEAQVVKTIWDKILPWR